MRYSKAPLSFQGQKRNMVRPFREILLENITDAGAGRIFIDVFGGSGLLSRTIKDTLPLATVVYNDYDDYKTRLDNVEETSNLLKELQQAVTTSTWKKKLSAKDRKRVLEVFDRTDKVDWITMSTWLLFSGNLATSRNELIKQTMYHRLVKNVNVAAARDYLVGLIRVSMDYRQLFEEYEIFGDSVVWVCDPPYPVADLTSYSKISYWSLDEHLKILSFLADKNAIYFTSNKGCFIDLIRWVRELVEPSRDFFTYGNIIRSKTAVNHKSQYIDYMLVNIKNEHY